MRVCLLSPALPGDGPVGRMATGLAARDGSEVVLGLTERRPGGERGAALGAARAVSIEDAIAGGRYDVAIATDWASTARLFEVPATRHAYWVDGLAHHRIGAWNAERIPAQLSYDLPVDFVAASEGVAAELADLRPDARWVVVRAGVDKGLFRPGVDGGGGELRVVAVELDEDDPGRAWAAGALAEAAAPVSARTLERGASAEERADAFAAADVVLLLSPVAGPPVEAMHCGAAVVVMPTADAEALVRHGENGIVAEPDDVRGVARWLDHLARDREWLASLRAGALATAEAWPSWDAAVDDLAGALERFVAEEPPDAARWPVRLMADAMAGAAVFRNDHFVLRGELDRLRGDDAYRAAVALRERLKDPRLAGLRRVAAPAARAARKRLG